MGDEDDDERRHRRGHKTFRGYGSPYESQDMTRDEPPDVRERADVDEDGEHPDEDEPLVASDGEEDQTRPEIRPPVHEEPAPAKRRGGTPMIEIEVVHEHGPAPNTERPWRTLDVWTRNRIYTLDPTMLCVEVRNRAERDVVDGHPFVGMRLVGGQHREGENIELSYPFPRPGTEAVFEQTGKRRGNFSRTSPVTRVILRLHIVTVAPTYVVPTWEEITGAFEVFPIDTPGGE